MAPARRPRPGAVAVHGGDQSIEAALDLGGVFLAGRVAQDVRGPVHPAVGARDVRP